MCLSKGSKKIWSASFKSVRIGNNETTANAILANSYSLFGEECDLTIRHIQI